MQKKCNKYAKNYSKFINHYSKTYNIVIYNHKNNLYYGKIKYDAKPVGVLTFY